MRPPWSVTSCLTMLRPIPVPCDLRLAVDSTCTNRSKIRSTSCGAMPTPWSATLSQIPSRSLPTPTCTTPRGRENLQALETRFRTMRSRWRSSPFQTKGPPGSTSTSSCNSRECAYACASRVSRRTVAPTSTGTRSMGRGSRTRAAARRSRRRNRTRRPRSAARSSSATSSRRHSRRAAGATNAGPAPRFPAESRER